MRLGFLQQQFLPLFLHQLDIVTRQPWHVAARVSTERLRFCKGLDGRLTPLGGIWSSYSQELGYHLLKLRFGSLEGYRVELIIVEPEDSPRLFELPPGALQCG